MVEEIKNATSQDEDSKFNEVKARAEERFSKFQSETMILGVRIASHSINKMIVEFKQSPGKKTANDYKRLVKKIEEFCVRSLKKDETENDNSNDETAQN